MKKSTIIALVDQFILNITLLILETSKYLDWYNLNSIDIRLVLFNHIVVTVLWLFFAYLFSIHLDTNIRNLNYTLKFIIICIISTFSSFIIIENIISYMPYSVHIVLILISTVSLIIWRIVCYELLNTFRLTERIMIVGLTNFSKTFVESLNEINKQDKKYAKASGKKVICIMDNEISCSNKDTFSNLKVIQNFSKIERYASLLKINTIAIAKSKLYNLNSDMYKQFSCLKKKQIVVTSCTELYEKLHERIPLQNIEDQYYLNYDVLKANPNYHNVFKYILDKLAGLLGCGILLIIIPCVWFLNLMGNKGHLFYTQKRVGKDNKPINVIKFRTMIKNAEKNGIQWAEKNDPRITKIGKLLRKLRLDEVPQFINILKGEMSLIGPRPERPFFVDKLNKKIPFYSLRHQVKPGITGWAQVMYHYTSSEEGTQIKLEYDLYYIKKYSIILDLKIIIRTIQVVLTMKGQ